MNASEINISHLPGEDNITRSVLPNGIVVLVRSNFASPSVVLSGYVQGGSIQDPPEKLGLALYTSYALMRGTLNKKFKQIYHELESAGSSFGFGASVHTTGFGGRALVEDLPLLLQTLADCVRRPVFPARQVQKLHAQLLTGLQLRQQDTSDMASLKFDELLFPQHPYGIPEDGYLETVARITRKDLIRFHCKTYGPQGMVITIVGAIEAKRAVALVNDSLGDWSNEDFIPPPPIPPIPEYQGGSTSHITIPGKVQTDLVMGSHGPKRVSDDFFAASLGNNILGQFGMMGRIGNAVREKSGLAYYASTSLNAWSMGGSWEITAGLNPANVQPAIDIIKKEVTTFINEPVGEDELEDVKANYIGWLPLSIESNSGVASAILRMERYKLGLNYLREYPARIEAITQDEILNVARKYLEPENMIIVTAGPE